MESTPCHKKRVLLIFPPCNVKIFGNNEGEGAQKEKTIAPPLGLLYLATELMDVGYEVEACDFNAETYSVEALGKYIASADLVGVSLLSFNRENADEIIRTIGEMRPELPIIAGGPDCMLHPRLIRGTRLTVVQEAEKIIADVVDAVLRDRDLSQVPGILYPDPLTGEPRSGAEYTCITNLDSIKFPARRLLRCNKGYSIIGEKASQKITSLITSRGCPKRCRFCAHNAIAYQKYRQRSAENVLAEIETIVRDGYEIIGIVDDNFTADKRRAVKILGGIRDMGANLTMAVQGRVDAADAELFRLMRSAGVKVITFGLESGNQDTLDFYQKETTVEQNRRAIQLADKAGLYTGGLFIIGAPMETREHFDRTYRFATSIPLDISSFWVLDYTFGSSLWEEAFAQGKVEQHEFNVPAGKERGTSPYPTKELQALAERYFYRFYRRPRYWIRQVVKFLRVRDPYIIKVLGVGIYWLIHRRFELIFRRIKRLRSATPGHTVSRTCSPAP